MEFKKSVITNKGRELMAKLLSGRTVATFTRLVVSSRVYTDAELPGLTSIADIKQTATVQAKPNTGSTVSVEGSINNTGLTAGYFINTVGLYASDPEGGEILYAVAAAQVNGYMPADTGVSKSGVTLQIYTEVSNASQVNMEVDPAAVASKADVNEVRNIVTDLQAFVGYNDADIYGVEVDMRTSSFKRLAGAVNRTIGAGFDAIRAFGGRRRCILTDEGEVLAYHGETGYSETGVLTQSITIDETVYAAGTRVQVMVEQPKFYYKVVPLEMDPITDGKGFHLRKARYYVSDKPKAGFKLHPAFEKADGGEKEFVYLAAYEGSLYDTSAEAYIRDDAQVASFSEDKMSSVAGSKPMSGLTQNLSRANARLLAQNNGEGWQQSHVGTISASQMLFLIEYAGFNIQTAIGNGATGKADGTGNESDPTGATTTLGNKSGQVADTNGINHVSFRGEENLFGNIWGFVDGLNTMANGIHDAYVATHDFADQTGEGAYKNVGFTLAKSTGYISAFGYSQVFDWLFLASETSGNSALPVGDQHSQNHAATDGGGWRTALIGGRWNIGSQAGLFHWHVTHVFSTRSRRYGGRLVYAPQ
ncbi:phage tail-collar fiber domain-containing protein [Enterococcus olivae]